MLLNHLRAGCYLVAFLCSGTALAELSLTVEETHLPRHADFAMLPVTITIDDVLPSDYDKHAEEQDEWGRLFISLPDSEDAELPLYHSADLQGIEGHNRHYWYEAVERRRSTNNNGNLNVIWRFILKSRGNRKLSALLQGTPAVLRLTVSYHHWEGEQYGDALLEHTQSFPRIDGVPIVAPQNTQLSPRHQRLHVSWDVPATIAYNNGQGEFPPAGVIAIVAAQANSPIDLTAAAMQFRSATAGGDTALTTGNCQLLPDCSIDCGDTENIYFDLDQLQQIEAVQKSKFMRGGNGVISNLEAGITYQVMLQYYPDGLHRSKCMTAVPVANRTLLELNGADDAKREDLRCFIASAATGSSRAVTALRWWRDHFLTDNVGGRVLTAIYYSYAPPLAAMIANHQSLRVLTRILLLVPLFFVLVCQYPLLLLILLSILAGYILLRQRQHSLLSP